MTPWLIEPDGARRGHSSVCFVSTCSCPRVPPTRPRRLAPSWNAPTPSSRKRRRLRCPPSRGRDAPPPRRPRPTPPFKPLKPRRSHSPPNPPSSRGAWCPGRTRRCGPRCSRRLSGSGNSSRPSSASPASFMRWPVPTRVESRNTRELPRLGRRLSRGSTRRVRGAVASTYHSRGTAMPPSPCSSPRWSSGEASRCSCPPRPTPRATGPRRRRRGVKFPPPSQTPPPPPPLPTCSRSRRCRGSEGAAPRRCLRPPRRNGR